MFDNKLIPLRPSELIARMNDLRDWRVSRNGDLKEFHRGVLQTLSNLKYVSNLDLMATQDELDNLLEQGPEALHSRQDLIQEARRMLNGFMIRLAVRTAVERSPVVGQKLEDSRADGVRNLGKLDRVLDRSLRRYGTTVEAMPSSSVGATLL